MIYRQNQKHIRTIIKTSKDSGISSSLDIKVATPKIIAKVDYLMDSRLILGDILLQNTGRGSNIL